MNFIRRLTNCLALFVALSSIALGISPFNQSLEKQQEPESPTVRQIGTVKSMSGNSITLKTDSGLDVNVLVQDSVRILRTTPGQRDLKDAATIHLQDLQVGDRMSVRGKTGDDQQTVVASSVIVMKQADIGQMHKQEREDWLKRSAGGIVSAVHGPAGTITISIGPGYSIEIKTSRDTGFIRYAPDSVKFADAKPGSFDQIRIGDQLRARGNRSADGKELAAEEVVSGTFRNIIGTVLSVDSAKGTVNVADLLTKRPVTIRVTLDSQVRQLTPAMSQGLLTLLKTRQAGTSSDVRTSSSAAPSQPGDPLDLQRLLGRVPKITLADLQKGEAVMIVAIGKLEVPEVTAVTLVGGVEAVLTASPNGHGTATLLSGWNMAVALAEAPAQ
jgi:hypothetical protein